MLSLGISTEVLPRRATVRTILYFDQTGWMKGDSVGFLAGKEKKQFMFMWGKCVAMAHTRLKRFQELIALPPAATDHEEGVNTVLVSDEEFAAQLTAWQAFVNKCTDELALLNQADMLIKTTKLRPDQQTLQMLAQQKHQCMQGFVIGCARTDSMEAAKIGVTQERFMEMRVEAAKAADATD